MRFYGFWLSIVLSGSALASPLRTNGTFFRDEENNHVMLRGVNMSGASKVPPFRVIQGPEDFQALPGWGFNSVRLLFNWEAFEPQRGVYDEGYLDYYLDAIRWAAMHKLYVIVDNHQDAYSRFTAGGCGDGFPEWALPPDMKRDTPKNDESCKAWGVTTVLNLNMHKSWHEFYKNSNGVRDRYLAMIQKLTRAVAHEPNVIGINLLNEPWGDEEKELAPLYRDALVLIRREMPKAIVFLSGAAKTSTGLIRSKLPRIAGKNIVHETHFYDPAISLNSWNKWALELTSWNWQSIQKEWAAPVFVGEFGAPIHLKDGAGYVDNIYEVMDRELYSGAHWVYTPTWNAETKDGWNREDFSINNANGELRGTYTPRPWIEKVSGTLTSMKWDRAEATLDFAFKLESDSAQIEVVVPQGYRWKGPDSLGSIQCVAQEFSRLACHIPYFQNQEMVTQTLHFEHD